MNGNALLRILATFGLLIASLWVAFDIFTSGSNAVARFYMYTMLIAGGYGLLNAKRAFYVLLFLTGYLDYFKRFMIFDSGMSRLDLYYVLGIAPATLAGITANILYQHFTGKLPPRPGLNKLIIVTIAASALSTFLALTSTRGGYRSIGDSVNATAYLMLLFVVPVLFRSPEELRRMLKILVMLYIPAILYMLVHHFRGRIFDWEMDYLKSGLTIEIRQLSERVFRPFGTMNAAANASTVFAGIWALCLSGMWRAKSSGGRTLRFSLRWLLVPLLAMAMYATYSRAGWVIAVAALLAVPFIKNRSMTLVGYVLTAVTMVSVVLASPYMLKHHILNEISRDVYNEKRTDEWAQTTNISTLNDRLEGFASLASDPRVWTPFGLRLSSHTESAVRSSAATHDMFTELLMNYGFVSLLIVGIFIAWQLWKLHTFVFFEREPLARSIGATCLAIGLCISSGATVNGAQFSTYPVNFFIWFNFAVVAAALMYARERDAALLPATGTAQPLWMRSAMRVAPPRPGQLAPPAHAKA